MNEKEEAIQEVEVTINAHRLQVYANNPENKDVINERWKELLEQAHLFRWTKMDITTQAVIARLMYKITKEPKDLHDDLKLIFAFGVVIGKDIKDKD